MTGTESACLITGGLFAGALICTALVGPASGGRASVGWGLLGPFGVLIAAALGIQARLGDVVAAVRALEPPDPPPPPPDPLKAPPTPAALFPIEEPATSFAPSASHSVVPQIIALALLVAGALALGAYYFRK